MGFGTSSSYEKRVRIFNENKGNQVVEITGYLSKENRLAENEAFRSVTKRLFLRCLLQILESHE